MVRGSPYTYPANRRSVSRYWLIWVREPNAGDLYITACDTNETHENHLFEWMEATGNRDIAHDCAICTLVCRHRFWPADFQYHVDV